MGLVLPTGVANGTIYEDDHSDPRLVRRYRYIADLDYWQEYGDPLTMDQPNTSIIFNDDSFANGVSELTYDKTTSTIHLANSTVNTHLTIPTANQYAGEYFLHANGDWVQVISEITSNGTNVFTGSNKFQTNASYGTAITIEGTSGDSGGPWVPIQHLSASPANFDTIGTFAFRGYNSANTLTTYGEMYAQIVDTTNGSEDGRYGIQTVINGTKTTRIFIGDGLYTANASDQGNNTLSGFKLYASNNVIVGNSTVNSNISTTLLSIANTTANVQLQPTSLKISNSTVNTQITIPTSTQYSGEFYLRANGSWVAPTTPTIQVFTANGTWTKPTGCRKIKVTCTGGGGGGGGADNAYRGGAGGGAGGTAIVYANAESFTTKVVVVGKGGGGGSTTGGNGANGSHSSFGGEAYANGGFGGDGHSSGAEGSPGGSGANGLIGDLLIYGGDGLPGGGYTDQQGYSGSGGGSYWGSGGSGAPWTPDGTGVSGKAYGSGGGGGYTRDGTGDSGGDGADGIVVVEEYY